MEFKNLSEISTAIKKWEEIIKKSKSTLEYMLCGNMFKFERTQDNCLNLHVYLGAVEIKNYKKLYIFLINEKDDVKGKTDDDLFKAITQCEVKYEDFLGNSDEIPEKEARERISHWDKNYIEWVEKQVNTKDGIFKAFNLPSESIVKNKTYNTFFSLKKNEDSTYSADLVTADSSKKRPTVFYDTVRPVPPFDFLPKTDFYLLTK